MRLVDDLMEPFRPLVDLTVWKLIESGKNHVTPDTKRAIVKSLYFPMETEKGRSPVGDCIQRMATSLALVYAGEREDLELPLQMLPIELASLLDH